MPAALNRRAERMRTGLRRATPVPFAIRCVIPLCGLAAMVVAWPPELLTPRFVALFALLSLWPAVVPRGRGATVVALTAVVGWLADTTGFDGEVALWRVLALAGLLYAGHTLTALAAVLPYDAVVNLDVPGLWLGRAAMVILVSAVLDVLVLGLTEDLGGEPFVLATLLGLAGAAGATLLLARLVRGGSKSPR